MRQSKLLIKTKNKNYSIFVGKNITNNISKIFKAEKIKFNKCLIIVDKKVPKSIIYKIVKKNNLFKFTFNFFNYFVNRTFWYFFIYNY